MVWVKWLKGGSSSGLNGVGLGLLILMSIDLSMINDHISYTFLSSINLFIDLSIDIFIYQSICLFICLSIDILIYLLLFIYASIYLFTPVALQGFSDLVPYDATHEGTDVGQGVPAGLLPHVVQIHICEGM